MKLHFYTFRISNLEKLRISLAYNGVTNNLNIRNKFLKEQNLHRENCQSLLKAIKQTSRKGFHIHESAVLSC